ncbi:MAG TPA: YkvA family protein [Xanthomonadaceae bacterium]|nr:YkvA family protein [Xanthomonadaceae bacterium]
MSVSISIELSEEDLKHFGEAMKAARETAGSRSQEEIVAAAGKLLAEGQGGQLPAFIRERLDRLDALIAMVRDEGWALPGEDRQRVLAALVYFADPADSIPDHVPVLGFLDDALMIELCVRDLQHELDAYDDFCEYRAHEARKREVEPDQVGRAQWLEGRREELLERMHRRRERDVGVGYGRSSGYGGRARYARAWRPGILKVT